MSELEEAFPFTLRKEFASGVGQLGALFRPPSLNRHSEKLQGLESQGANELTRPKASVLALSQAWGVVKSAWLPGMADPLVCLLGWGS